MPNAGLIAKAISALVTGIVGWVTMVVNSAPSEITSQEWIVLATAVTTAILVFVVPNSTASDAQVPPPQG